MLRVSIILFLAFLISCNSQTDGKKAPGNQTNKWVSIFNGNDLEGWTIKINKHEIGNNFANTFSVENGILSIRYDGYGENFDDRFGAIFYNKVLTNYRLKLEYRFVGETAPGAPDWGYRDSGVQFHSQSPASMKMDQPFPICLEYNLHGGNGRDERPSGAICTNGTHVKISGKTNESFCTPPTIKKTFHGDQWVSIEIDIKDGNIVHLANGEEILSYNNPTYNTKHEIGKTFIKDGNAALNSGYISLQSNSHPIDFRKIELMEY